MTRLKRQDKPQRSCLGCRGILDQDKLLRFVLAPDGVLVPDIESKLPGRGAYTCISESCLCKALKQNQFNRSFKQEIKKPDVSQLVSLVKDSMVGRIHGYIGLSNKAGKVVSGGSLVSDAIRSAQKPGLVLLAVDVSAMIGNKIEELAAVHHIECQRILTKDEFGAILGKAPRSAIAIKASGFVAQLTHEIKRYRNFLGEVQNL